MPVCLNCTENDDQNRSEVLEIGIISCLVEKLSEVDDSNSKRNTIKEKTYFLFHSTFAFILITNICKHIGIGSSFCIVVILSLLD